ncbi:hypothetical protein K456DRAFT_51189 [Colletotrichum gloeosporioides 23]|nr:hypothetical protein K456DRAFT_51189 [Colletotrichum gloeosporioides 23]
MNPRPSSVAASISFRCLPHPRHASGTRCIRLAWAPHIRRRNVDARGSHIPHSSHLPSWQTSIRVISLGRAVVLAMELSTCVG